MQKKNIVRTTRTTGKKRRGEVSGARGAREWKGEERYDNINKFNNLKKSPGTSLSASTCLDGTDDFPEVFIRFPIFPDHLECVLQVLRECIMDRLTNRRTDNQTD